MPALALKNCGVDGGATVNDLLMQFQSNILNTTVVRPVITETTALGAAYLAGLAVGYWENMEAIQDQWQADKKFTPGMENEERHALTKEWQRSVRAAKAWAEE